jgi:hypothetical protein
MENNKFVGTIEVIEGHHYEFKTLDFNGEFIKIVGRDLRNSEIRTYYLPSSRSVIKLYGDET